MAKVAAAATDPYRPLLAQIVVSKRCNLACGYCYEHDDHSPPVPMHRLRRWVQQLQRLRVVFVTLNGGEPLLNPDVVDLVHHIQRSGMIPMMNSNGMLLTEELIHDLGRAGLLGIQISCDGMVDNDSTRKTMQHLRPKLDLLAEHARFRVRVNTVLGSAPPQEAIEAIRIVLGYGFDAQCSLIRDASGAALPLSAETQEAYATIRGMGGRLPSFLHDDFQVKLVRGEQVRWKCRSGARYFHVDGDGLVHVCQPRTGTPGKPLEDYDRRDIEKYFHMYKPCSPRCPHAYAHIGSRLDGWRHQAAGAADER